MRPSQQRHPHHSHKSDVLIRATVYGSLLVNQFTDDEPALRLDFVGRHRRAHRPLQQAVSCCDEHHHELDDAERWRVAHMIVAYGLPAQLVCAAQHDRVRALVGMWLMSSVCRLVLLVCVRVLVRLEGVWCYHSSLCGDSTSMFVFTFLLCSAVRRPRRSAITHGP